MGDDSSLNGSLRDEWVRDAIKTRKLAIRAIVAWAAIASLGTLGGLYYANQTASYTHSAEIIAHQSYVAAQKADYAVSKSVQTNQLVRAIANERYAYCVAQNARNTSTVKELHDIVRMELRAAVTRTQHREIRLGERTTLLLIGKLAPIQDCSTGGT